MKIFASLFIISFLAMPFGVLAHGSETHIELSPFSGSYKAGEEFSLIVTLNSIEAATSFRIHLPYDASMVSVVDVQANTDAFPFWWKQEAVHGVVQLEASVPPPGFQGEEVVAQVVFRGEQNGVSNITVDEESLVLNTQNENIIMFDEGTPQSEVSITGAVAQSESQESPAVAGNMMAVLLGILVVAVIAGGVLMLTKKKNV
jgi:hypothetical protein